MLDAVPDPLAARVRSLNQRPLADGPVLYWMRTAVRADENPALDVAIHLANAHGRSVWVYHALSERYPYASDRHHRFVLEGARDVAAALAARGVAYACHVEHPGQRGPHLHTLAAASGAIVTEEMPVDPLRRWARAVADRAACAVFAVDTACVVPMRTVGRGVDRAFRYRQRVLPALDAALEPRTSPVPQASALPPLPFVPVDPRTADLDALIADSAIDHTVPPVADTRGGSSAGYARWQAFVAGGGLDRYAADRNDPLRHGVSRMSAYLHYGMVAPTRIAREARDHGGRGADKFVDELIVWRELAYTWCLYARHHDTLDALPAWARATLLAHASDPRRFEPPTEALHRGTTGVALWDLAQRSLLRHGELHNNVRMTWGKALVDWSPDPATALARLVDLNHRYALDGRDPASYGGLLWCMGQFDRPFPEGPVLGTVRSRSVRRAAERVDLDAWAHHLDRDPGPRVAIVGAGLAGSFAGRVLADHGATVTLFDKGRGPGGRTSCRRDGALRWCHGASHLDLGHPLLDRFTAAWVERGLLEPVGDGRWAAHPPNELVRHLQAGLDVRFGARVERLERQSERWSLHTADGGAAEGFDVALIALPAPQAAALLACDHPWRPALDGVRYAPAWVALLTLASPLATPLQIPPPLRRLEGGGTAWVAEADAAWSAAHLEAEADEVATALAAVAAQAGLPPAAHAIAHRWRYARVTDGLDGGCRYDPTTGLGLAGDLFAGGDAGGALRSGAAVAGRVLGAWRPSSLPADAQETRCVQD